LFTDRDGNVLLRDVGIFGMMISSYSENYPINNVVDLYLGGGADRFG
jgi:hypothetical protein